MKYIPWASNRYAAYQVCNGFTRRGDHARQKKSKQGPLSSQCLARTIVFVILAKAGLKVRPAALAQAAPGQVQRRSRTVRHG